MTHTGAISVLGNTSGTNGGGGAGGSVWITAGTLTGNGSIRANGGWSNTGSGGGGRIAIHYGSLGGSYRAATIGSLASAYGGTGVVGAAGTVFLKSTTQTYGDLLIDNNNLTSSASTSFGSLPTVTASTGLTASTLTNAGAFANDINNALNQLVGLHLNPRVNLTTLAQNQNATLSLMDDSYFEITENTVDRLTIVSGSNMTAAPVGAVAGDGFRIVLDLDNFEIRGRANLSMPQGLIRVREGDLSSDDTTTFRLDGTVSAHAVDIGSTGVWTNTTNGVDTGVTRKCSSTSACP